MKKSHKIIIALLSIALIVTIVIFSYRYGVIAKAKTGYLVYADNTINVIDLKNTTKTKYNVDGYYDFGLIGKYYGGDFCCTAINNETTEQEIVLFKNGVVEKSYSVSEQIVSISAYNDKVYYLTEEGRLNGSLYCIYENETEVIESNVEEFALNSLGEIVYIKEKDDNDKQSSMENDSNGELYYLANGKSIKLGEAYSALWLNDNELLVDAEKVNITYRDNGDILSAMHSIEEYIVTVENNKWTYSEEFNRLSSHVIEISPDNNKAITFITDEAFTTPYYGIYHIEKDIFIKKAVYDGTNNKKIFDNMNSNTLWLDKNPME